LLGALTVSNDAYVIKQIHQLFDGDIINDEEKGILLQFLLNSVYHNDHIDWVMENFDRLINFIPETRRKLLPNTMKVLCDSKQLARERAFYLDQHKMISESEFDFLGGLEAARQCIALRNAQPPLNLEALSEH